MRFLKRNLHFCFFLFYVGEIETEKRKQIAWKRLKNPIKIVLFKVVIQKYEKSKKMDFCKTCLTLLVSGREKKRIFVHTICFGQTIFWDQKQCKPGKTIKIVVSAEIAQNQK